MLPIHVAVLHNEHALAMLDGFHHGDPLAHVFSYSALQPELFPTGSDHDVCEQAFMLFNAPEEALTELDRSVAHPYRKRALRSLSVGDVLCVIRPGSAAPLRWFACASRGFEEIDAPADYRLPGLLTSHLVENLTTREEALVLVN